MLKGDLKLGKLTVYYLILSQLYYLIVYYIENWIHELTISNYITSFTNITSVLLIYAFALFIGQKGWSQFNTVTTKDALMRLGKLILIFLIELISLMCSLFTIGMLVPIELLSLPFDWYFSGFNLLLILLVIDFVAILIKSRKKFKWPISVVIVLFMLAGEFYIFIFSAFDLGIFSVGLMALMYALLCFGYHLLVKKIDSCKVFLIISIVLVIVGSLAFVLPATGIISYDAGFYQGRTYSMEPQYLTDYLIFR